MKTYPMEVLRQALLAVIDKDKYVRFTIYTPSINGRMIPLSASADYLEEYI